MDRAVELNPSDADVLAHAALCRAYLGEPESALALAERAVRLNPRCPEWYVPSEASARFILGRFAEAAALIATAPLAAVDSPAYLAAACALDGDVARAREAVALFVAEFTEKITFGRPADPGEPLRWVLHVNPFRRKEDAELLARGLRLAGLAGDPDDERPAPPAPPPARPTFRPEGAVWLLAFDDKAVRLTDTKGFRDLALLLGQPHLPIHCLELAGRSEEPRGDDPVFDRRARQEVAARARELDAELAEAEAQNDPGRAELARAELDRIATVLSEAFGLGGRSRRLGSATERARSAVTWRIRSAIRKIAAAHPALARHLENAVRTGRSCTYSPERPIDWAL